MEKKKTKSEIVKLLLNRNLETEDEEQLLDLLIDQPIAIDVDREDEKNKSFGDRVADKLTAIAGSWSFIIGFIVFLIGWIVLNLFFIEELDPYPFILLNLVLSCIAALQAPIIMMSQNREAKREVLRNQNDYKTDLKSELILEELHDKMEKILENQKVILASLEQKEKKHDTK
ncbi:MAG: DUF1003 domain-containing protein [Bacilli bacterium]|nr:DUF1003 domain-containing protein [Bacilli bacterium]